MNRTPKRKWQSSTDLPRIHVIYGKPSDWPHHYLVRGWQFNADAKAYAPELGAIAYPTLEWARVHCKRLGLAQHPPLPGSDPVIREIWAPLGVEPAELLEQVARRAEAAAMTVLSLEPRL